jgi:zinc transport system substrate-binding protein
MSIIKKAIVLIISISMIFSIVGCGKMQSTNVSNSQTSKKFTVVTSFYPMYIFTKNIAKDIPDVEVVNMTEPQTGCLHDYQLSTSDMKTLENANVFVVNGAGMETFMDKVTKQMTNLKVVEASKGIELIESEHEHVSANADKHDEEKNHKSKDKDHEHEHEGNPHVWVGVSGAIQEVKNITEQLTQIDAKNAEKYRKNGNEYVAKLEALKNKMTDSLKNLKNRNVVTFHEAFPYFAKEFNLNVVGVIEKEPGEEPSAEELADIIKIVKEKKIKALFTEEQYSPKAADTIAKETGAKVYQLDLVVTGAKDADPESYIKAMEKNLTVLLEALS